MLETPGAGWRRCMKPGITASAAPIRPHPRRIRALAAAVLLLAAASSALANLQVRCDNELFPPGYSRPACQTPPVVSPGQSFVVLGEGAPTDYQIARAYIKLDDGGRTKIKPLTLLSAYRSSDGRIYSDSKVRPDGRFNVIVEVGEGIPEGRHALWIELRFMFKGAQQVDVRELSVDFEMSGRKPWKKMGQETFACDGPTPKENQYVFQPLFPPMIGSSPPTARCFAGGSFSFTGGPYEELPVVSKYPNFYIVAGNERRVISCKKEQSVLPDQIFRAKECVFPAGVTGPVTLRITNTINPSHPQAWHRDLAALILEDRSPPPAEARPDTKPKPPAAMFRTTFTRIEQSGTDFFHPDKATLYPGRWAVAALANTKYFGPASGGFDQRCPLMLGERKIEEVSFYRQASASTAFVSFLVPKDMPAGTHELRLSCPNEPVYTDGGVFSGIEARGDRRVAVAVPRSAPRARVIAQPATLSGNPAVDELRKCKPCNGEEFEVEISGLDPGGDVILEANWTNIGWPGSEIAKMVMASGATVRLRGRIPPQGDTNPQAEHLLALRLRDRFNNEQPLSFAPDDGRRAFNFFLSCPRFDPKSEPRVESLTPTYYPSEDRIEAHVVNLECSATVDASLESPALPGGRIRLNTSGWQDERTDADGNFRRTYQWLRSDEPFKQFIHGIKEPTVARVVFETKSLYSGKPTGRRATAQITVYPAYYITLKSRKPAKPGERVEIEWKGFKSGTSARVLFDGEESLTHRPVLLDGNDPVVTVRLLEGVVGRHTLTLVDAAGNSASTSIEIEGEGYESACTAPCLKLPARARQGERFEAGIGGFAPNEQLVVRFADKFEIGKPYQGSAFIKQPITLPRNLPDGVYRITVTALGDDTRTASAELRVAGGYAAPTLRILCPGSRPLCDATGVAQFHPGETLHTSGTGWSVKGKFSGALLRRDGQRQPIRLEREGCVWGFVDGRPQGKPCDEDAGEIDKYWALPEDLPGGDYVLEITDAVGVAQTRLRVVGTDPDPGESVRPLQPVAEAVGPREGGRASPGDRVEVRGKGFAPRTALALRLDNAPARTDGPSTTDDSGEIRKLFVLVPDDATPGEHRIEISPAAVGRSAAAGARTWSPVVARFTVISATPKPTPTPAPEPTPPAQKPCDPDKPRFWQPGCVEQPGASAPAKTPSPTACNPSIPRYMQPGCVENSGEASAPPSPRPEPIGSPPAQRPAPPESAQPTYCDPDKPRFWQPGCVQRPGAGAPAKTPSPTACNPSIPRYMQPGCIEAGSGTSAPKTTSPQRCNPNIPSYAQPGCVP
jgi:hypothetical protein